MELKSLTQNYIAVIQEDAEKTEGGLYVPFNVDLPTRCGEVVMVGPGVYQDGRLVPTYLVAGMKVAYYDGHSGLEMKYQGKKVKIMRELEVFGILEK